MSVFKQLMHLQAPHSFRAIARYCISLFLAVTLLLLGGQAAWAGGEVASSCPANSFEKFLEVFAEDSRVQAAHTRFPLKRMRLQDADPEPKPIYQTLSKNETKFPVMPNAQQRNKERLQIMVESAEKATSKAVLYKRDTGYLVNFYFERDGCWTLVFIEDWSM